MNRKICLCLNNELNRGKRRQLIPKWYERLVRVTYWWEFMISVDNSGATIRIGRVIKRRWRFGFVRIGENHMLAS